MKLLHRIHKGNEHQEQTTLALKKLPVKNKRRYVLRPFERERGWGGGTVLNDNRT